MAIDGHNGYHHVSVNIHADRLRLCVWVRTIPLGFRQKKIQQEKEIWFNSSPRITMGENKKSDSLEHLLIGR